MRTLWRIRDFGLFISGEQELRVMNLQRRMTSSAASPFASDPEIMGGRLLFRGTRIPVDVLFENLADGMSLDEILDAYPGLQRDSAVAAIELACAAIQQAGYSPPT